jgi:phosphonate metabolism protein (transferase hexapeptide repeat family)
MLSEQAGIPESCRVVNSEFGIYVEIGEGNYFENSTVGDFSYTGPHCYVQNTEIGKFSNIAASVRIGPTAHPMNRITQHHFTYRRKKYGFSMEDDHDFFEWRKEQRCKVGHDTWIGHGAILLPNVTIGNGSVIGAGSIVTKDIPPFSIAVGNPARVIRKRFDDEVIQKIQELKWWDWSYEQIKSRLEDFSLDPQEFLEKYLAEEVKGEQYASST